MWHHITLGDNLWHWLPPRRKDTKIVGDNSLTQINAKYYASVFLFEEGCILRFLAKFIHLQLSFQFFSLVLTSTLFDYSFNSSGKIAA